jgi:hypothetical protein
MGIQPYQTLLDEYVDYLMNERCRTPPIVNTHRSHIAALLKDVGGSPTELSLQMSHSYDLAFFTQRAQGRRLTMRRQLQGVLRSFLRFCFQKGHIDRDFSAAPPCIRSYKLANADFEKTQLILPIGQDHPQARTLPYEIKRIENHMRNPVSPVKTTRFSRIIFWEGQLILPIMPAHSFINRVFLAYSMQAGYEKLGNAMKKFHIDFMPDVAASAGLYIPGKILEILDYKLYHWPGHGVPENTSHQCVEAEYMKPDEYRLYLDDPSDYFLRTYLPRVMGGLAAWKDLPCFSGNFPSSLLKAGTVDQVKTHCKQLLDDLAGDGGYSWSTAQCWMKRNPPICMHTSTPSKNTNTNLEFIRAKIQPGVRSHRPRAFLLFPDVASEYELSVLLLLSAQCP